jgi:hypothetical protein
LRLHNNVRGCVFAALGMIMQQGLRLGAPAQRICSEEKRPRSWPLEGRADRGLPVSPVPLVSPCVKRRGRWPSAPGIPILAGAKLNATAWRNY